MANLLKNIREDRQLQIRQLELPKKIKEKKQIELKKKIIEKYGSEQQRKREAIETHFNHIKDTLVDVHCPGCKRVTNPFAPDGCMSVHCDNPECKYYRNNQYCKLCGYHQLVDGSFGRPRHEDAHRH